MFTSHLYTLISYPFPYSRIGRHKKRLILEFTRREAEESAPSVPQAKTLSPLIGHQVSQSYEHNKR